MWQHCKIDFCQTILKVYMVVARNEVPVMIVTSTLLF
jgi:hypothetical protein